MSVQEKAQRSFAVPARILDTVEVRVAVLPPEAIRVGGRPLELLDLRRKGRDVGKSLVRFIVSGLRSCKKLMRRISLWRSAWFSTFVPSWCSRSTQSASEGSCEKIVEPGHAKPFPSCREAILQILWCRGCSRIHFKGFLQASLEPLD